MRWGNPDARMLAWGHGCWVGEPDLDWDPLASLEFLLSHNWSSLWPLNWWSFPKKRNDIPKPDTMWLEPFWGLGRPGMGWESSSTEHWVFFYSKKLGVEGKARDTNEGGNRNRHGFSEWQMSFHSISQVGSLLNPLSVPWPPPGQQPLYLVRKHHIEQIVTRIASVHSEVTVLLSKWFTDSWTWPKLDVTWSSPYS